MMTDKRFSPYLTERGKFVAEGSKMRIHVRVCKSILQFSPNFWQSLANRFSVFLQGYIRLKSGEHLRPGPRSDENATFATFTNTPKCLPFSEIGGFMREVEFVPFKEINLHKPNEATTSTLFRPIFLPCSLELW